MIEEIDAELSKSALSPSSASLKRLFWESRREARRNATRSGYYSAAIIYVLFSLLDWVVLPDVWGYTVVGRMIVLVCTVAIVQLLFRRDVSPDVLDAVCATGIVTSFVTWLVLSAYSADQDATAFYRIFGAIFMMGANLFFSFRFRTALATSVSILIGVLAIHRYDGGSAHIPGAVYLVFYGSCFGLTLLVNFKTNLEHYRTFLNSLRASILQRQTEEAREELLTLSHTDSLTGVANRRAIDQMLMLSWRRWTASQQSFAVALVDVDFFKKFNDWYGHVQGDQCLVRVASVLTVLAREQGGHVGRYGGEEFLIVVPIKAPADLQAFGDRICAAVHDAHVQHICRRDGVAVVTASVGLSASYDRTLANVEQIIHQADQALYLAKERGRNQSCVFDASQAMRADETEFVAGLLKIAVDRQLLSVAYQPIVGCRTGKVEAVECLMRLTTLEGKPVPPPTFIPIAEEIGIIVPLGLWIIEQVCRDILIPGLSPCASVNVSAVQLGVPGFAMDVAKILLATGVPGHRLVIEITEGRDLDLGSDALRTIADLKALGIKIWLDDFGTGYAGLSWLSRIEFDAVKIDKSFVWDINTEKGLQYLTNLVAFIHTVGAEIVMEGIEDENQLSFARASGTHHVQGYLLGRPASLAAVSASQPRMISA